MSGPEILEVRDYLLQHTGGIEFLFGCPKAAVTMTSDYMAHTINLLIGHRTMHITNYVAMTRIF